ncbi:unnamed protein product [Adineta steineri]|uniref:Uncharacterized protein n=2 Tax=Adineta steineri TaxID=433720 RepID=A0A818X0W5_9BILA|nr:unnamed protein product [Adineta steineri]CAF3733211.1 unnamed protein product [Adineta steineri]
MCLGCGSSTQVPDNFVGKWTHDKSTYMSIEANGKVHYIKSGRGRTYKWNGPVSYNNDGFSGSCCFCFTIEGKYNGSNPQQPTFIVDGDVLTKTITQQPGRT